MDHPLFEIVTTTAGAVSIRHKLVNEIMHNPVGPWVEANALYIEQSNLKQRLGETTSEPLVLFDIGLGAAANSLATLACAKAVGTGMRPLHIVSFERDLELLRFALAHSSLFEHFFGYEQALEELLTKQVWSEGSITWELRAGDFLEKIQIEPTRAHLIFFDPYSPKKNNEMWTIAAFEKLRQKSREPDHGGTCLYTYSQATRIRAAMMKAGFHVGYGQSTGLKETTTEASTDRRRLRNPVGPEWFSRWEKSHLRYPFDCEPEQELAFNEFILEYRRQMEL